MTHLFEDLCVRRYYPFLLQSNMNSPINTAVELLSAFVLGVQKAIQVNKVN